jgi:hypothetical protein
MTACVVRFRIEEGIVKVLALWHTSRGSKPHLD